MTSWIVYRCKAHKRTTYVNAGWPTPVALCCDECKAVTVADEGEFCTTLRALKS